MTTWTFSFSRRILTISLAVSISSAKTRSLTMAGLPMTSVSLVVRPKMPTLTPWNVLTM